MIHRQLKCCGSGTSSVFEDLLFGARGSWDSGGTFLPQGMMGGGRGGNDSMGVGEARGASVNPKPNAGRGLLGTPTPETRYCSGMTPRYVVLRLK